MSTAAKPTQRPVITIGTTEELRRNNLSNILGLLHRSGPLSRAGLTCTTRLNRSTVGAVVADLAVYAMAAVPTEMMEAARLDGASELRMFRSIAMPMMVPGMVTVFILQFVGIWNKFLLPFIMLSDQHRYPITVGLYTLLSQGSGEPALQSLAIIGAALSIIPLVLLMLFLQRFWRLDLISGGLKG